MLTVKRQARSGTYTPRRMNRFLILFTAGLAAGAAYTAMFGRTSAGSTGLLGAEFFSMYGSMEIDAGDLFLYTLKSRMNTFTLLWLTGMTVFGAAAVYLYLFWMGAAFGIIAITTFIKMGAAGVIICIVGVMPQLVLYVPAVAWLLKKICAMSGIQYWRGRGAADDKRLIASYCLVWAAGLVIFLFGSFLESCVNPLLMKMIL